MTVIVATHTSATGQRHAARTLACGSPVVNTQQSWSPTPVYTKVSAAAAPPIVRPPSKVWGRSLSESVKFPAPARLRSVQPPTSHIRQSFAICEAWGHYSQKIQHASDDKCRYLRSRHSIVYESANVRQFLSHTGSPAPIPRHSPPSLRSPRSMKSCLCFGCFGGGLVFFSPCHFEVITRARSSGNRPH